MGIKSTRDITREEAICRISDILSAINQKDYLYIEENSCESDHDADEFVATFQFVDKDMWILDRWTNSMLEKCIDRPFFRYSMFDNYFILDNYDKRGDK